MLFCSSRYGVNELAKLNYDYLMTAARNIYDAWNKWNTMDGPFAAWQGGQAKRISDELARAIIEGINKTSDIIPPKDEGGKETILEVTPDARQVMLLLDRIGHEYKRWERGASQGHDWAAPFGSKELADAFQRLVAYVQQKRLPPPEPMVTLQALGAPHAIIAKKYGFKNEDGTPDEIKVALIMRDPAKFDAEFDPAKWVHPAQMANQAEIDLEWSQRIPRMPLFAVEVPADKMPEPPSIEAMIQAKAPAQQILNVWKRRMPELTLDYIEQMAKESGVELDTDNYTSAVQQLTAASKV